ncbi:MAG: outer membrane lipoprotein carrier protein LolA, partial [Caldimonas sp.]
MPARANPAERRAVAGRRTLLLAGLAAAMTPALRAAPAFDLAQLTAQLARVTSGEARFTEKRRIEMLDRTLESSGRLAFRAPDSFTRETLKPRREKL